jgi:hypothetical protein
MSASCVTRRIERRTRLQTWGIEIETWQLLDTRTLPTECARLPLSTIFDDPNQGAVPATLTDDEETLETPIGEITRENEAAPDYVEITAERPAMPGDEDLSSAQQEEAPAALPGALPHERTTCGGGGHHGR